MISKHNARLMREAIGDRDGEQPITHGNLFSTLMSAAIVLTALALATINEDPPAIAAAYVDDAAGMLAVQEFSALPPAELVPAAKPAAAAPQVPASPAKEAAGDVVGMTN